MANPKKKTQALLGDIAQVEADAIVAPVASNGVWLSSVDHAIFNAAGDAYHKLLMEVLSTKGLSNGQIVCCEGNWAEHKGKFNDVLFIVDTMQTPLNRLVYTVLVEAYQQGYRRISMPLMRTGEMLGKMEKDTEEVISQMLFGIQRFSQQYPGANLEVTIVTHDDIAAYHALRDALK